MAEPVTSLNGGHNRLNVRHDASAICQTPALPAQPAIGVGDIVAAIKPGHVFTVATVERGGKGALAIGISTAGARKNRHGRNSARRVIGAAPLDVEHRAMTNVGSRKTDIGQRHDQPTAVGQSVEPMRQRMVGRAGIDVDDVGRREIDLSPVAGGDGDVLSISKIVGAARGEPGVVLDCRDPAAPADKTRKDRRVIAQTDTDMDYMFARFRRRAGDEPGVQ
jgi:hypothetical protein